MINVLFNPEKWEAIRNHLQLTEGADYTVVESFVEMAQKVEAGEINALSAYVDLIRLRNELDESLKVIQPLAIDEADKYPGKSFKAFGATIEKRSTKATWDYSAVAAWSAAKERLEWIEKMAKAGGAADSDSGEIIEKAVRIEGRATIAVKV